MLDPAFRTAFDEAKRRIRAMDFRFVEGCDQNAQALLEIYCTIAGLLFRSVPSALRLLQDNRKVQGWAAGRRRENAQFSFRVLPEWR